MFIFYPYPFTLKVSGSIPTNQDVCFTLKTSLRFSLCHFTPSTPRPLHFLPRQRIARRKPPYTVASYQSTKWATNQLHTCTPTPSSQVRAQGPRLNFLFSMKLKTFHFTVLCFLVHRKSSLTKMVNESVSCMYPYALKANQSTGTENTFPVFNEVKGLPFHFF